MRVIINKGKATGSIYAQPSKSYSHRLLIGAALSTLSNGKENIVKNIVLSNDIKATISCLQTLGLIVNVIDKNAYINKDCNISQDTNSDLVFNCFESGSTLRFFIPIALALNNNLDRKLIFKGTEKLISRGIGPYQEIFEKQGLYAKVCNDEIVLCGKLKVDDFIIPGNISSQFVTGLLFAMPLLKGNSKIILSSNLESKNYVDMTIDVLNKFGVNTIIYNNTYMISNSSNNNYIRKHSINDLVVEGDYSNAAFIDSLNYLGGNVIINGLNNNSYQGDKIYKELFKKLNQKNVVIDISNCIDLGPILFCMASLKYGAHFVNTSRLKIKESDRVLDLSKELAKFNVEVIDLGNEVIIKNENIKAPECELDGHNDHRIVMALSVMLTKYGGVISGAEAINKSYPQFFNDLRELGIEVYYE